MVHRLAIYFYTCQRFLICIYTHSPEHKEEETTTTTTTTTEKLNHT